MLLPYKVTTTREIRDRHWQTLYSPTVDDEDKQKLWTTKYDLRNFEPDIDNEYHVAALAKLGLIDTVDLTKVSRLALLEIACHSVNSKLLTALGAEPLGMFGQSMVNLLKRGYFQAVKHYSAWDLVNEPHLYGTNGARTYEYLTKFTLEQFLHLDAGLHSVYGHRKPSAGTSIESIIWSGSPDYTSSFWNKILSRSKIMVLMLTDLPTSRLSLYRYLMIYWIR